MDYITFKNILARSKRKIGIIGVFITAFSVLMVYLCSKENSTTAWVLTGIMLLVGLLMLMPFKDLAAIRADEYPLLKAIKEKQPDYLIWIYNKHIATKVEGVHAGTANNVVIYTKNNKMQEIVLGRKTKPTAVIQYLSAAFPDAYVGYDADTRAAVAKLLKKP